MYKVKIDDIVILEIDNFIDSYLHTFLNLFADSGIPDLSLIEENYYNSATAFRNLIYKEIETVLSSDIVGFREEGGIKFTYCKAGNYRLKVFYEENEGIKQRTVIDIRFKKK